jgi:hypothetical protein
MDHNPGYARAPQDSLPWHATLRLTHHPGETSRCLRPSGGGSASRVARMSAQRACERSGNRGGPQAPDPYALNAAYTFPSSLDLTRCRSIGTSSIYHLLGGIANSTFASRRSGRVCAPSCRFHRLDSAAASIALSELSVVADRGRTLRSVGTRRCQAPSNFASAHENWNWKDIR